VIAAYGEMASEPPRFADVRVPTLLLLGAASYLPYDRLLDAHRAALGELLEVVTVQGGHTVLWDAPGETAAAVAAFLAPAPNRSGTARE
jgi:pimeloyl-ACP methyl ester carboxylesterase